MALTQKGVQTVVVRVVKATEGAGGEPAQLQGASESSAGEVVGGGRTWKSTVFGTENPKRIKRIIVTNSTHAIAVGRQMLNNSVEYALSGISDKTGDQSLQQSVQRTYEQVSDVGNIASSASMGALYGAWGGPIGSVLGMVLATTSTAINTGFKYMRRERENNIKLFKENNGIAYQRARANINWTTGRLR